MRYPYNRYLLYKHFPPSAIAAVAFVTKTGMERSEMTGDDVPTNASQRKETSHEFRIQSHDAKHDGGYQSP